MQGTRRGQEVSSFDPVLVGTRALALGTPVKAVEDGARPGHLQAAAAAGACGMVLVVAVAVALLEAWPLLGRS